MKTLTPIHATDARIVPFSQQQIWNVLVDIDTYPRWWPSMIGLRVERVDPNLIGSELKLRPLGGRAFRCRVASVDAPNRLVMEYFGGFIEGIGVWHLEAMESATRVQYELDVRAAGKLVAWIGRVIPLAKFHSVQMESVLRQLEKRVNRTLHTVPHAATSKD
jgi:ribosome-associated toxin RatA of RatAB toxin-antitoxin module